MTDLNQPAQAACAEGCHYATHMQGGAPISVSICTQCKLIDFDDLTAQAVALATPSSAVPFQLQGDGPCGDCGTGHNIRWFTDDTLWNEVLSFPNAPSRDDPGGILCIPCFVARVDAAGLSPRKWRLLPEWHWETKVEREERAVIVARYVPRGKGEEPIRADEPPRPKGNVQHFDAEHPFS